MTAQKTTFVRKIRFRQSEKSEMFCSLSIQNGSTHTGLFLLAWQMRKKGGCIMEIVKKEIQIGDQPTFDALKEVESAKNHEINYEDAPKLSEKELLEFVPANPAYYKPKKQQITLKLDADVIEAFKRLGKGYQTKINATLRKAIFN